MTAIFSDSPFRVQLTVPYLQAQAEAGHNDSAIFWNLLWDG
ncbi:MAG TPA: hypothetical protein VMP68_05720 [Candidatus Eisenbacteria bacterium]|nr:hypothetical protein [Candidatus Eisenbacteria bacterium]